jgi:hypothetical protein
MLSSGRQSAKLVTLVWDFARGDVALSDWLIPGESVYSFSGALYTSKLNYTTGEEVGLT